MLQKYNTNHSNTSFRRTLPLIHLLGKQFFRGWHIFTLFGASIMFEASSSYEKIPEYSDLPAIQIISPLQGSYYSENVQISWLIEKISTHNKEGAEEAIIFVNGVKAHSSAERQGSLLLEKLPVGGYRIEAMLGTYDDFEGLTKVLSTHVVEFRVGSKSTESDFPHSRYYSVA
jgi:hypothetical protein